MSDPVFPSFQKCQPDSCYLPTYEPEGGLTKRELFAAMAMQGMMTHSPPDQVRWSGLAQGEFESVAEWVASNCVAMADAMIEALKEKP